MHDPLVIAENSVTLQVIARPGSSRSGLLRVDSRGLTIALNCPPEKGRANRELLDLLAKILRLPRSAISILRGSTARTKTVRILTPNPAQIAAALRAQIEESRSRPN